MGKLLLIVVSAVVLNGEVEESQNIDWPNEQYQIKCDAKGIAEMYRIGYTDEVMSKICE